ncbi:ZBTB9 protein, partial [Acrocephalus arundinaceus]|nr:ZBTB9 protein [Acrocephalus arundinaceus]
QQPGPGGPCPPCPCRVMAPGRVRISFPRHAPALLDSLNRLRLQGKFCDVTIHAGGRVFAAHGSVLAAASPFFHDKLLLHAGPRLTLPPAVNASAFEGLLELIYCGRLTVAAEALPGHLLVASALQMWHVVERCSQILRELEGDGTSRSRGGASALAGNVHGHDGSSARNVCDAHDGASAGNVCGYDGSSASAKNIRGHDGASASNVLTIRDDSGAIHSDIATIHGDNDPSSSWATHATSEELLQLRMSATTSPFPLPPSQEILKIRVGDDDNEGSVRVLPDDTAVALPALPDPPAIFYIKPEPATVAVTTPDIPPPAKPPVPPGWTPVDLHGNELLPRGGQPAHAPVKLGAAPADGKRFGCACGKRFAARPKRDRHILLTLSLRPFACTRCPKRFKLKHHLGEHMKTH